MRLGGKNNMDTTYRTTQRLLATAVLLCVGIPAAVLAAAAPTTTSLATLTRDTPFGEAIDALRNATTPPLNIVVLWRQIGDGADIYRETPIGFDSIPGLRLRQVLEILLSSVSAGGIARLDYIVDGGAIVVATPDTLPRRRSVPRVYDVTDLVAAPSYAPAPGMMRMMGGGMMGGYGQGLGGYNAGAGLPGVVGSAAGSTR